MILAYTIPFIRTVTRYLRIQQEELASGMYIIRVLYIYILLELLIVYIVYYAVYIIMVYILYIMSLFLHVIYYYIINTILYI